MYLIYEGRHLTAASGEVRKLAQELDPAVESFMRTRATNSRRTVF